MYLKKTVLFAVCDDRSKPRKGESIHKPKRSEGFVYLLPLLDHKI